MTAHTFSFSNPLYAIADILGRAHLSYIDLADQLCRGGARVLQLRAKELSTRDFLSAAQQVHGICHHYSCLFIVNDRSDIALAVDADGVHLGQEDLPLGAARKLLGPDKIIGISTHDPEQARMAEHSGANYIGFGPLFGTATKATGYSARGIEQLRHIRSLVSLPIVAIGGITAERAQLALAAGANAVAMISDLVLADNVASKVQETLIQLTPC